MSLENIIIAGSIIYIDMMFLLNLHLNSVRFEKKHLISMVAISILSFEGLRLIIYWLELLKHAH